LAAATSADIPPQADTLSHVAKLTLLEEPLVVELAFAVLLAAEPAAAPELDELQAAVISTVLATTAPAVIT
jgi:hypothetical protein